MPGGTAVGLNSPASVLPQVAKEPLANQPFFYFLSTCPHCPKKKKTLGNDLSIFLVLILVSSAVGSQVRQ